ncbi:dipeptidase PepV [Geosporobacter ferrireducens]|uniref:Dipeptidase PepV n=1 Tax=Geosporobacter ferrireducens TaxID=1424294 RepID=A0A1D8GD35_9FIRM|nr:dipeptidase PepV [Geosporobacter ferrireducens]AOT68815.1 dipeptidase PepV [Geosporobacter ferrireducens]MTI56476.1 dipeptidase PepV [Geosporobacter ferrireducens]
MLEQKILSMEHEIIQSTQEILRIKSVKEKAEKGKPFGNGINEALQYALRLAKDFGFETKNFDGYAGHAEFGSGEEIIGVLVHLDVVPEGTNWSFPPYSAEIHDGKIYARGAIDDKGPAIAALYAMKAIKDLNLDINKKIRIIFGTDEESGWGCMKHYFEKEKAPSCAFTPDAEFPVIHGEKGIVIFDLVKELRGDSFDNGLKIKSIKGGNRANMVPDYCEAQLICAEEELEEVRENLAKTLSNTGYSMEITEKNNIITVKSYGISAHGSTPEQGKNAISQLLVFLSRLQLQNGEGSKFVKLYADKIGMEFNGESIGCGFEDDASGKLVFNVGVIDFTEQSVRVTVNIRYPITYHLDAIYEGMKEVLGESGVEICELDHMKPIYMPKDHELVQRLMKVYREITGDQAEPITIGGGTYARAMENAVAFGPLFPGQPELAHQKDEYIAIGHLMKITNIYAQALYELAK